MQGVWGTRLGFDFSRVRVHHDDAAAESARSVGADAYTVGNHIAFAQGAYDPGTRRGQALIAHELAHVVQQRATPYQPGTPLPIGASHDPHEAEANALAAGTAASPATEAPVVRRGDAIDVDLVPDTEEDRKQREAAGIHIDLPKVSAETWRLIGGVANNAGAPLSAPEAAKIEQILKTAKIDPGTPGSVAGAKFLLHDTAALVSAAAIAREQTTGRGPLGAGVAAWVPRAGDATIARPNFYETARSSTTEFEKVSDKISKAVREREMRKAWGAAKTTEQDAAITRALTGLGLTADEISKETKTAKDRLAAGATSMIMTTGAWAVRELCAQADAAGAAAVAKTGKDADLTAACTALGTYFTERAARVGTLVPMEIVQDPGVKDPNGNIDSCNPANPNLKPLPRPAYTADQYRSLVFLYLRAARAAGRFPEVTTHFVVDAFVSGHCDPRCFNLQQFYDLIAAALGHGKGSTYGPKPSYGTKWGTNNIWWDNTICGGSPP